MTEDEARSRWCPFARTERGTRVLDAQGATHWLADCACIASNCMAWRWTSPPHWRVQIVPGRTQAATKDEEGAYQTRGNGFCGLAGKPETP